MMTVSEKVELLHELSEAARAMARTYKEQGNEDRAKLYEHEANTYLACYYVFTDDNMTNQMKEAADRVLYAGKGA